MYGVEVHVQDLNERSSRHCSIMNRSVECLVNSSSINSIWYELNFTEYSNQEKEAEKFSRYWRKLWSAYNPDGEQAGFYVVPFFFIFGYLFLVIILKKKM